MEIIDQPLLLLAMFSWIWDFIICSDLEQLNHTAMLQCYKLSYTVLNFLSYIAILNSSNATEMLNKQSSINRSQIIMLN